MGARHRRSRQFRRKGRHTTPSQVEKVAEKAGKAAPAMACAGVIAAVPATHDLTSVKQSTVAAQAAPAHLDAAISPARSGWVGSSSTASAGTTSGQGTRTYTVASGDTLSSISKHYYSTAADWPWLWHENSSAVQDANLIYSGQKLNVPSDPPSNASSMSWYQPKHAAPTTAGTSQAGSSTGGASSGASGATMATDTSSGGSASGLGGTLGCSGLEQLWQAAGGNPADSAIAASIAMAESGGNQYATGGVGEEGYWQINPVNGALATYDALGNAKAAVTLSGNGSNWSPWTTYTSGAYMGRC